MIRIYISFITLLVVLFFSLFPIEVFLYLLGLASLLSFYHYSKIELLKNLRIPLLISSLAVIYFFIGTWKGTLPATTLLASLCFLKLFEVNEKRDIFSFIFILQLFVLSLSVQVEEFYYLGVILFSLFLSFFILYMSVSENHAKVIAKNILALALKSSPLIIVLLIVFPRYQFGGFFFSKNFAQTGFSETLVPGDVEKLVSNTDPLFNAEISFPIKRSDLYWRGQVLSLNKSFSWSRGKVSDNYRYKSNQEPIKSYEVSYQSVWNGPLFTLDNTSSISMASKAIVRKQRGGVFQGTSVMDQKIRFKATVSERESLSKFKNFRKINLQVDQLISERLRKFLDDNKEVSSKASRVELLLGEVFKKDFTYTLAPGTYSLETGFDEFFFDRKRGFCGHFTTASAILFRLFDIPARVVTGYLGGEYNEIGDFYTVTQKDAHVWVEYIDDNGHWKRFDPVSYIAPNRIEYESDIFYGYLSGLTTNIDQLRQNKSSNFMKWLQYMKTIYYKSGTLFFNYDLQYQKDIVRKIKSKDLKVIFSKAVLTVLALSVVFLLWRVNFVNLILFINLFKRRKLSWSEFKLMDIRQMRLLAREDHTIYQEFVSTYEQIVYTRPSGPLYKLSFILRGLKMMVYEKTI
ncbi:DUF3488 and transglutaminase-like domain-containing protein [Halobacteriovorax sp. HLS]|uniref:transglutaminase family protein n=1 Tax=Halobacteriovorax sp. HLS TaxID=2234000 RepID=UPI000FD6DE5C|nr:DUF3488 and transglutaminase-like domain-containing protein [Halobacteriovorax sp. HLS]